MNVVVMMGRLTKDPDVRYTKGTDAKAVANYDIAVDRFGGEGADFFRCVVWGKQAEVAEKYLRKGSRVAIHGRLQNNSYQNRDGATIRYDEIVVQRQEFAESRAEASARNNSAPSDDFISVPDDLGELPFME